MCGHRRGRDTFLAINTPRQSADVTLICQKLKYTRWIFDTCFRNIGPLNLGLFIKMQKKNKCKFKKLYILFKII